MLLTPKFTSVQIVLIKSGDILIKRDNVRICVPRYMQIGKNSLNQLPEILSIIGSVKSLLIVTDKQMVKFGYVKKLQDILLKSGFKSNIDIRKLAIIQKNIRLTFYVN